MTSSKRSLAAVLCPFFLLAACEGALCGARHGDGGPRPDDAGCVACTGDASATPDSSPPGTDGAVAPDGGPLPSCEMGAPAEALAFDLVPDSAPDVVGPGRGAALWHGHADVDVPVEGAGVSALDDYYRLVWTALERGAGDYDWTRLDELLDDAIENHRRLSFGIMSSCPGCDIDAMIPIDGAMSAYPADLHRAMQGEARRDWISDGHWVPNWNSPTYLSRYEALLRAIDAHLGAGSHLGIRYSDAIGTIDIRGYGSWGEWHVAGIADTVDDQPPGRATAATLTRLVDMHVNALPSYSLVAMICIFDGDRYGNMGVPVEVAEHMLAAHNDYGPIGWRRDNWGALDSYIRDLLDRNPEPSVRDGLMERWRTAPIVGEPPYYDTTSGGCPYADLETQVRRYHAAWFGNGNYGGAESQACMRDNVRDAARASGYRIVLEGGSAPATLFAGARVPLALRWHNVGIAPSYEEWEVVYELRDASGGTAWSAVSSFEPRLFLPDDAATEATDEPVLPSDIAPGTYDLALVVRDPTGLRDPLPLAIEGRRADGSYLLRSVTVADCP